MKKLPTLFLSMTLSAVPVAAFSHHVGEIWKTGPMWVSHAWTEETGEMAHGIEVFLTVENTGDKPERLVAATTTFTQDGSFQAPLLASDGALVVKEVPAIQVNPGQTITFQPGGIRIVLQDVKRHLEGGQHFHMTLTFQNAGPLEVDVEVEHGDHDDPDHDHRKEKPTS